MSTTPNMSLVVPEVLITTGPTYATQVNSALDVIDAHDHSPGKGVRVTPSGLNINADLAFNNNSATNLKSLVLAAQTSATNGAIYRNGDDLFYKRGDGTIVQITTSGGVNVAGIGGISGLASPASATYTSATGTFAYFSGATTFAKTATGDLSIYSRAGSSLTVQAVTLKADATVSAYDITFPLAAPGANQLMRHAASGAGAFVDLLGTNNQVTVTQNTSNITLSLPQNIHTAATPTFAGLTLTGALGGTSATLSGALQAASATITGNVSLTGSLGSTVTAPNYTLSLNALTVNTIGATVGSEVYVQGDLSIQTTLKTNTIAVRTGSLVTFSNGITMPFLPITAGAISGSTLTASSSITGATLNIASSATLVTATGITTNQLTCPTINAPGGVEIAGRTSGVAYPSFTIGETTEVTPGGNVNANTSYQQITSWVVPAGVWRLTAIVQFEFTADNNFGGGTNGSIQRVEAALSTSASSVSDQPRYMSANGNIYYKNGELITMTVSQRHISATPVTYYLIGKTRYDSLSGTNAGRFTSAGSRLILERVG